MAFELNDTEVINFSLGQLSNCPSFLDLKKAVMLARHRETWPYSQASEAFAVC